MKIPKYVINLMERSQFALGYGDPGYTIEIKKETPYTKIETLIQECRRLVAWAERQMPHDEYSIQTAIINSVPSKTHYQNQYAVVTIYDPVMKWLEKYIRNDNLHR